ncbi:OPT family oligopeptide transporter [Jutongia huaianensis]|uniref:Oligopeptide transporter, OPT family n=1 Tax=Jutongia huaianensis TaxID=2763668 RepID=A0ABR7N516_9FIRM|nr:oligopeptide transporter, OPT family [Jutongia huaianensis]MBC8563108.1 oligopeptide transporter, OPT family [Jutongia huaianensis]
MSKNEKWKPIIPADKTLPEFTPVSLILGLILAVVFGAANAYLGLRVGMTVSASIPAAVISMGILRYLLRRDSILENNMVQTIGSAGESLAAGAIFTMPALFMWAEESHEVAMPSFTEIAAIAVCGGLLGVLFMVPLRNALIVEEHGALPFPEGTACAEVLLAGEEGGAKSKVVFAGLGISALYKFITDGLKLFPSEVHWNLRSLRTAFGLDVLPALAGVGYICGRRVAANMFAGGVLGWFVLIPAIVLFGGDNMIAPAADRISEMDVMSIWGSYIRYIGAGAVAAGGIISLIKTFPVILRTFTKAVRGIGVQRQDALRTSRELPMGAVLAGVLLIAVVIWLLPSVPVRLFGAMLVIIFGFFFATVSSRMVGLVGSSNNPVSGMAIATLLIATALLKGTGMTGYTGMVSAICVGTVICIVAAMAGDTSQDLKTGFIVGATPMWQQIGELIGAVVAALTIGGVMYLLHAAWGFGNSSQLPAPQATLMKLVVEGVMGGTLPWGLVFCGVFVAIVIEILGLPVLPVSIGLYLPIHLSAPIFVGGMIRKLVESQKADTEEAAALKKDRVDRGLLYSSGMIAGEGLIGIFLAVLAVIPMRGGTVAQYIQLNFSLGNAGGIVFFIFLLLSFLGIVRKVR